MRPDLDKARTWGGVLLAAAVVASAGALWYVWDDGAAAADAESKLQSVKKIQGRERLRDRIEAQRQANAHLVRTIADLKAASGIKVRPEYRVPKSVQANEHWKNNLIRVREAIKDIAFRRSILKWERTLGFPYDDQKLPPSEQAQELMTMLQLKEKAMLLALSTPDPLQEISEISHEPPEVTGPPGHPGLLREYRMNMTVVGGLSDILSIVHGLAAVDPNDPNDYPLILTYFRIDSTNTKSKDSITQLTATIGMAGMEFLDDPSRPAVGAPAPAAGGGGGKRVARP